MDYSWQMSQKDKPMDESWEAHGGTHGRHSKLMGALAMEELEPHGRSARQHYKHMGEPWISRGSRQPPGPRPWVTPCVSCAGPWVSYVSAMCVSYVFAVSTHGSPMRIYYWPSRLTCLCHCPPMDHSCASAYGSPLHICYCLVGLLYVVHGSAMDLP